MSLWNPRNQMNVTNELRCIAFIISLVIHITLILTFSYCSIFSSFSVLTLSDTITYCSTFTYFSCTNFSIFSISHIPLLSHIFCRVISRVDAQSKLKISRKISRNSMKSTHRYGEIVITIVRVRVLLLLFVSSNVESYLAYN
jgi:hypothetical protein